MQRLCGTHSAQLILLAFCFSICYLFKEFGFDPSGIFLLSGVSFSTNAVDLVNKDYLRKIERVSTAFW